MQTDDSLQGTLSLTISNSFGTNPTTNNNNSMSPRLGSPQPVGLTTPNESQNVKVMVRVRPFNSREFHLSAAEASADHDGQPTSVVYMRDNTVAVLDHTNNYNEREAFAFDVAFWSIPPEQNQISGSTFATQETVFESTGMPAVESALKGYNCCLMAYGQTGSGKTHTMLGSEQDPGISPRLVRKLFQSIEEMSNSDEKWAFTIELSFMEIYNEKVKDLLAIAGSKGGGGGGGHRHLSLTKGNNYSMTPASLRGQASSSDFAAPDPLDGTVALSNTISNFSPTSSSSANQSYADCKVRYNPEVGTYVEGLTRAKIESEAMCLNMIRSGMEHRAVASTKMNDTSSRSHAIFQLCIKQKSPVSAVQRVSIVNLVDLAGSEKIKLSGATGNQLVEAKNINSSLSTLRRVIDILIENSQRKGKKFVPPFRESVLTWVLSDSLGGNSKTMMLATVSPHVSNVEDTLNTLRYALKAKAIVCHAKVNEEKTAVVVSALKAEMDALRLQLLARKAEPPNPTALKEIQDLSEEFKRRELDYQTAIQEQQVLEEQGRHLREKIQEQQAHLDEISPMLMMRQETAREAQRLQHEAEEKLHEAEVKRLKLEEEAAENLRREAEIEYHVKRRKSLEAKELQSKELSEKLRVEAKASRQQRFADVFRSISQRHSLKIETERIQKDMGRVRDRAAHLEKEVLTRRTAVEKVTLECNRLRGTLETLDSSCAILTSDMENVAKSKNMEIRRVLQSAKDAKDEVRNVILKIESVNSQIDHATKQRSAIELQHRLQLSDVMRDLHEAQIIATPLENEVALMSRKIAALEARIEATRAQVAKEDKECETLEAEHERKTDEIAKVTSMVSNLEAQLNRCRGVRDDKDNDITNDLEHARFLEDVKSAAEDVSNSTKQYVKRKLNPTTVAMGSKVYGREQSWTGSANHNNNNNVVETSSSSAIAAVVKSSLQRHFSRSPSATSRFATSSPVSITKTW